MQKSRQVSLTPTRLDLNRHPFFLVAIEIVKTPWFLTTPTQPTDMGLIHPPPMSNISSLALLPIIGNTFLVSDVFWCIVGNTRSACSWNTPHQGAGNTGNRCLFFRLVQTQSDFRPMGFCWQRCFTFSTHQLFWILHQVFEQEGKKP